VSMATRGMKGKGYVKEKEKRKSQHQTIPDPWGGEGKKEEKRTKKNKKIIITGATVQSSLCM